MCHYSIENLTFCAHFKRRIKFQAFSCRLAKTIFFRDFLKFFVKLSWFKKIEYWNDLSSVTKFEMFYCLSKSRCWLKVHGFCWFSNFPRSILANYQNKKYYCNACIKNAAMHALKNYFVLDRTFPNLIKVSSYNWNQ